jgi:SAM-dependent methyltransferase
MTLLAEILECPECRKPITVDVESGARCEEGHHFQLEHGVVDFIGGGPLDAEYSFEVNHACEGSGMERRVANYIIPWLRQTGLPFADIRLLEDGCGLGHTVAKLVASGVDAYGIDPGKRSEGWAELGLEARLLIADGTRLPFASSSFDVVTSSGVLEHVGEGRGHTKRGQHSHEAAYMKEILRVLKPGGRALVAHPNGAFPVDFWHGYKGQRTPLRLHVPYEAWMPNARRIKGWLSSNPNLGVLRFLPPEGYLSFERVRTTWYGRRFSGVMEAWFSVIDRYPYLASGPFSPWLISEFVKRSDA